MFKNISNTYLTIVLVCIYYSLHAAPSIEVAPTVIQITGLDPINLALKQTSRSLDKVNIAIDKLKQIPHIIGIMTIGIYVSYWAFNKLQKTEMSHNWSGLITNSLLIAGGVVLTVTAPILSSRIHRMTI